MWLDKFLFYNFCSEFGFPGIFDNFIQARMFAQEAIPKWQSIRARTWTFLQTLRKLGYPNIEDAAILNATPGLGLYFCSALGHSIFLHFKITREKPYSSIR
jgi:hypothetical protein